MASEGVMDADAIPFGIVIQSRSGFSPTSGHRHHPVVDYTRTNIDHLRGRRSIKQVGEESGAGQSWLQRFLNPDSPSGIQKANAEKLGQLARYFGVSVDAITRSDLAGRTASQSQSQPARFDDATMAQAVEMLYIMRDARPDDRRFHRPTWSMILVAAKCIDRAEGDPRGAMAEILAELAEV